MRRQQKIEESKPEEISHANQPRTIKMRIKIITDQKFKLVTFDYDMISDTPESIANEMKHELSGLNEADIKRIRDDI